jgi:hypothetical protein
MDSCKSTEQGAPVAWVLTIWELSWDGNSDSERVVAVSLTKQGLLSTVKDELDVAARSVFCKMTKRQKRCFRAALESDDVDAIIDTWNTMRCHALALSPEITAHPLVG